MEEENDLLIDCKSELEAKIWTNAIKQHIEFISVNEDDPLAVSTYMM